METLKQPLATYEKDGTEYGFFTDPEHETNQVIKRLDTMQEVGYVVDRKRINAKLAEHIE